LASVISDPGLLPADDLDFFPDLWRYFVGRRHMGDAERERLRNRLVAGHLFNNPPPSVRFLGVFDTVPGSTWDMLRLFTRLRFYDLKLDPSVEHAVHILAMDDDRNPSFSPLLWNGRSRPEQTIEQIWMPGVHSDVGGSSDATALGNIALLTMLNRLKKYCPEIEYDDDYIDTVKRQLMSARRMLITSERPGVARKLLLRRARQMGVHADEYIHPIVPLLLGQQIMLKGRFQTYRPANYSSLPIANLEEADGGFIAEASSNLLNRNTVVAGLRSIAGRM
jgi:hypothetical protein